MDDQKETDRGISFSDIAPVIEFSCWIVVVVAPCLRLINGAAVTNDQWWIQVVVFISAILSACSLRVYQALLRRKLD